MEGRCLDYLVQEEINILEICSWKCKLLHWVDLSKSRNFNFYTIHTQFWYWASSKYRRLYKTEDWWNAWFYGLYEPLWSYGDLWNPGGVLRRLTSYVLTSPCFFIGLTPPKAACRHNGFIISDGPIFHNSRSVIRWLIYRWPARGEAMKPIRFRPFESLRLNQR